MNLVLSKPGVLIIDDFLDQSEFDFVWTYVQSEDYEHVHRLGWVKAWRLSDGVPLRGPVTLSHENTFDRVTRLHPTGKAIDILMQKLIDMEEQLVPWVGKRTVDWSHFFCRPYLYPVNTGLSWHRDNQHNTTGAFTFYCHRKWNVQWGGELLVADSSSRDFEFPEATLYEGERRFLGTHFDNRPENQRLMETGIGTYILPKPNRLIVLQTGLMHCIKRVDPSAGNSVRITLQGTFMYPSKSQPS